MKATLIRNIQLLFFSLFCFLNHLNLQGQVTPLEAIHVVEIHTGGTVDRIEKLNEPASNPRYELHGKVGRQPYRAVVHSEHGRLMSIHHVNGTELELVYHWPGIRVVAHRGGALLGPPENTLPAIEKAIEVGADLIEVDIRQTRDGHLVLMHDEAVNRTTDGQGKVEDLTLGQILALSIKHDGSETIRVPTLKEALETMKGRIDPDLDYKDGDISKLIKVVKEMEMVEHSTMYGSWERCRLISDLEPRMRIRPTADYPMQVPELARTLRPALINMDWHGVSEEAIRLTHIHGCQAFVNCLERADTEFYMQLVVAAGADYIQSDRPDLVVQYLKGLNLYRLTSQANGIGATPLQSSRLRYPFR